MVENLGIKHPDPEEANRWLEGQPKYEVYGRYVPD